MKRIVAIVCILLMLACPAYAHSGKTDANGGHTNHATGEYHYHHGYSEHQHPNGKCPYDYDEMYGESSSVTDNSDINKSAFSAPDAASAMRWNYFINNEAIPFIAQVFSNINGR